MLKQELAPRGVGIPVLQGGEEVNKCIVKVTPPNGVPIYYASRHSSTMDAAIDAMERYGHAAKISVKRMTGD